MMAEPTLKRAATAPVGGSFLTTPPQTYAPSRRRTNRRLRIQRRQMEHMTSNLRQRNRSAPNLPTSNLDQNTPASEETLTPTSSNDRDEVQATPSEARVSTVWQSLLGRVLGSTPFQATTEAKSENKINGRYSRLKHKKLVDHVQGTARFGAFLNSNDSFCIFRKFADETARILLRKQLELCELAAQLDELDKADVGSPLEWRLGTFDHEGSPDSAQNDLLDKFEIKIVAYYDLLSKFIDIRALPKVPERYHRSVYNWVYDNGPLVEGEEVFLENVNDFIMARRTPETKNLLEDMIEKRATKHPDSLLNHWLGAQEEKLPSGSKVVHLSTIRFDILGRLSAALLAIALVLAPVLVLFLANLGRPKMAGVTALFILAFLFGAALVVDLTSHEIFILIVAYSAILVTLLSNFLQANAPGESPQ